MACLSPRNRRVPPRCEGLHRCAFHDSSTTIFFGFFFIGTERRNFWSRPHPVYSACPFFKFQRTHALPKSSLNRLGLRGIFKPIACSRSLRELLPARTAATPSWKPVSRRASPQ